VADCKQFSKITNVRKHKYVCLTYWYHAIDHVPLHIRDCRKQRSPWESILTLWRPLLPYGYS